MSEIITGGQVEEITLEELLGNLESNMRLYDQLTSEIATLTHAQLILASLEHLVIDKKLAELQSRKAELENISNQRAVHEFDRHLSIATIEPRQKKVAAFHMPVPSSNIASSFSGWRKSGRGRLFEVGLQPSSGGYLKLKDTKHKTMYQANPLFDRDMDYQPVFEIIES